MSARWATAMVRIECLDAAGRGAAADPAGPAGGEEAASLLVRVQVSLAGGERQALGPAAATPAQADALVLTAMGGIYRALGDSCADKTDHPLASRYLPGEP